jgi:hypothetical protein
LRVDRERRMAAGEDQPQPVVADTVVTEIVAIVSVAHVRPHCHLLQLGRTDRRAAQLVDGAIARRRGEPRTRIAGQAVAAPSVERKRERVLHALFREVPVAGNADERGDDSTPFVAKSSRNFGFDVV